ncbi:MAG: PEP-CTERM sorting domain-containing protein [Phycisphaeraceae bacterium]
MNRIAFSVLALPSLCFAPATLAVDVNTLYNQTGTDPTWQELLDANAIPIGVTSTAGVSGSDIDVINNLVEVGPNANNPIMNNLRIHTLGNSSVQPGQFDNWSRWYQEDGNTQVFRLFEGEENVRNSRAAAARIEAFDVGNKWQESDGQWFKWEATYTIIKPLNSSIFQAKNPINDWSVQLNMTANGDVRMNRRVGEDITMATNMVGVPFHVAVYDNGLDYRVYFNDVFQGDGQWARPEGDTNFRWGMYMGANIPANDGMLFVTGAKTTANASLPTPPTEPGVVLAGWDTWSSGSEAASVTNFGVTGNASEIGDWRESDRAASNDGTFGSEAGASTATGAASTGTYIGITGDGAYDFTITAGNAPIALEGFHFDAQRKRANSPENWAVEVVAGDISLGAVGNGTLDDVLGGIGPSDHVDLDLSLALLADNVLDPGQSATFRISFTGGNPTNSDQRTYLDNVAITGNLLNPAIPGDTDNDGDIDDSDLGTAFSNYTGPVGAVGNKSAADGDTDGDGDVDDSDLGTAFSGYTGPMSPASVPEPTSLALLSLGGLAVLRRRGRS